MSIAFKRSMKPTALYGIRPSCLPRRPAFATPAVAQRHPVSSMSGAVLSVILLAATPMPAPVHVTVKDLAGMWITVQGDCSKGQHQLGANGEYRMWCFDSISDGQWSLRGGDKIVVRPDPKKPDEEIITVLRFGRYADHSFLYVRYQDGRREKWMK